MSIIVTKHAFKRMKERMGLNKKASLRTATKAHNDGYKHSESKGRLKRYLDSLWLQHRKSNEIRIYGRFVYLFHNNTLITVVHLPKGMEGGL